MKILFLIYGIVLSLTGCSSFTTGRYSVATENVMLLRDAKVRALSVGSFTSTSSGQRELSCRGIYPIRTADGESYAEFVRKAFVDEFRIAGVYSASSPLIISGNIDSLDFSSTSGNMKLTLTVRMSNGRSVAVSDNYSFPTGLFDDANACGQAAQAFIPTVQNVIRNFISSREFISFASK